MEIVYHPLEGAAGHWEGYEFLQTGNEEEWDVVTHKHEFFSIQQSGASVNDEDACWVFNFRLSPKEITTNSS